MKANMTGDHWAGGLKQTKIPTQGRNISVTQCLNLKLLGLAALVRQHRFFIYKRVTS